MKKTLIKLTLLGVIGSTLFTGCSSEEKKITKQDFLEQRIKSSQSMKSFQKMVNLKDVYKITDIKETVTKEEPRSNRTKFYSDISYNIKNTTNSFICLRKRTMKFTQEKSEKACTSQENGYLIAEPNGLFYKFDKNKKRIPVTVIDKIEYSDYEMIKWIEQKQKFENLKASNPQN